MKTTDPTATVAPAISPLSRTGQDRVLATKWQGIWRALRLTCLLAAASWGPACWAAGSQLIEKAFVLDPGGTMTLEQAQAQTATPFSKYFDNAGDISPAWIRLRIAPPVPSEQPSGTTGPAPSVDKLRLVPLWTKALSVHDPLQRDANGRITEIDLPPSNDTSHVYLVNIPASAQARDVWVRFQPGGNSLLAAELLSAEQSAERSVWDAMIESITVGMLSVMLVIGAIGWWIDRSGIGRALFFKQLLNLVVALQTSSLLFAAGLADSLGPQGATALEMGLLRMLNQVVSLWFFIKVMQLFEAARWALHMQRLLLVMVLLNGAFLLIDQEVTFRLNGAFLHLLVLIALLVSGFACQVGIPQPPARFRTCVRLLKQFSLGLLMALAWIGSFVSGFFRSEGPSPAVLMVPLPIIGAVGMLFFVGLRQVQQENTRRQQEKLQEELRELALLLERGERERQREFMVMLTHELKAPLSTLGIVLLAPNTSDSMRRHAGLALASMRQVIDHCAQSVEFEEADAPVSQTPCSLWVEVEQRHAALAERDRVQLAADPGLPSLQTDQRMLAVVINNLLANALTYSPSGSPVEVSVTWDSADQAGAQLLRVSNQSMDGRPLDASRMFQKYYRGEGGRQNSGSGLGLYLSRLLARRLGGDLVYEAGHQSVIFTLRLPVQRPAPHMP